MKRLFLGLVLTLALVLGSSLLTWKTTGVSYDHFTWAAYAGMTYPETEDEVPGGCSDGEDNDLDTFIDCADDDCANQVPCVAPAPAMSVGGIALLMGLLMFLGLYSILRRRGHEPA